MPMPRLGVVTLPGNPFDTRGVRIVESVTTLDPSVLGAVGEGKSIEPGAFARRRLLISSALTAVSARY
jgi:hypothetical protein